MDEMERNKARKALEEMNVIEDFLFREIMADEQNGMDVCRMILSCVLNRKIGEISYTPQREVPGISEVAHGIRLDVYIKEVFGTGKYDFRVYDVEPDNKVKKKGSLPRRSRYYADIIDSHLLQAGDDFDNLPELITIFILSYDPFGADAMYYEAGSVIKTHPDIPYDDGVRRIFLYTDGRLPEGAGEAENTLKNLLRYVKHSSEENVTDDNTKKLNEIVKQTKANKYVGIRFMKSWEIIRDAKDEGRDEERVNTERERKRADDAEKRVNDAEKRINAAELRIKELEASNRALRAELAATGRS